MKKGAAILLAVVISAAVWVGRANDERVGGAALLEDARDVDSVLFELLQHPLSEEEVLLFLEGSVGVLKWAEQNPAIWLEADESDRPLEAIRSFRVWRKAGLTAEEFAALVAKLIFTREIQGEGNSVGAMREELAEMAATLEDESVPVEHRELIRQGYEQFLILIEVVEKSGPQNLALYVKHQDPIDLALKRFDAVGE